MAGPTWYDSNYLYRAPIVVDGSAASAGIKDANFAPHSTHEFWLTVQSTGYDVRFTAEDGFSLLAYNRAAWNYSARSASFDIDSLVHHTTNTMTVIWMYWGYSGATDGSTSPAIASALNAYIAAAGVTPPFGTIESETVGTTSPTIRIQKTSGETLGVSWRVPVLGKRAVPWQASTDLEGIKTVVLTKSGTLTYDTNDLRMLVVRDELWVTTLLAGGADGDVGNITCTITTTHERILTGTAQVTIENY